MSTSLPKFTPSQWEFLAVMAAFDMPVSPDILCRLVQLSPAQFLELIRKCESLGWIYQHDNGPLGLSDALPNDVRLRIEKINTSDKLATIVHSIQANNLIDKIPQRAFVNILRKSEDKKINIRNEIALTIEAFQKGEMDSAKKHMMQVDLLLPSIEDASPDNAWFIPETIKLCEYCIVSSVELATVIHILERVIDMAQETGNERSWTIANLLLGRTYWLQSQLHDAIFYLARGKEKAEELGDNDILTYAAVFIGVYYFVLGYLNKAAGYLKPFVTQFAWTNDEYSLAYEAPILLSYCDVNRGDFYRAVGAIDFFRQLAIKRQDYYTASLYRAVLGINLWAIGRREEALFHLESSQTDALASGNMVANWIALHGLSCLYLGEGDVDKGLPTFKEMTRVAREAGVVHQVFHPIFLESFFNAEQAGGDLPPEWRFDALFEKIMADPNIDMQGTALRLRAVKAIAAGKDEKAIFKDLQDSEALLVKCEDSFQLAKTKIELVRFYLRNNQYEKARGLAYDVYKELTGYCEIFFPDDLGFLLEGTKIDLNAPMDHSASLEPILRILEELFSRPDVMNMDLFLSTLSRFFRAERSAIFVFDDSKGSAPESGSERVTRSLLRGKRAHHDRTFSSGGGDSPEPAQVSPQLRTARNLSRSIISDQGFRRSMTMVIASYREKKPVLSKGREGGAVLTGKESLSAMCLPLVTETDVKAVLYFDNSYLPNCFDFVSIPMLESLGRHLAGIVEKQGFGTKESVGLSKGAHPNAVAILPATSDYAGVDIIIKDHKMVKLLNQARRLAESETPILILGETGSGKEVVAQWIHRNSLRHDKPFVVVDLTTIPENLMDSELFGHEKGAFTGAHQQKIGRVELAEGGTLFFDEIGEIPVHLQVKLLRLLEQKTFVRVGGTKTKRADFRLVAATNRNLFEEVKAGRFREDLYYRLNALELNIPPLRERKADIVALAHHFFGFYARKYNKKLSALSEEQTAAMQAYSWPGNVRELKHVIERAVLVAESGLLEFDFSSRPESLPAENLYSDLPTLDEVQRRYIQYVLNRTDGKISGAKGAAEILDVKRSTLVSRMKNLGMR